MTETEESEPVSNEERYLSPAKYDQLAEGLEKELNEAGAELRFVVGRHDETLPRRTLDSEALQKAEEYGGTVGTVPLRAIEAFIINWLVTINSHGVVGELWVSCNLIQGNVINKPELIFGLVSEAVLKAMGLVIDDPSLG